MSQQAPAHPTIQYSRVSYRINTGISTNVLFEKLILCRLDCQLVPVAMQSKAQVLAV
jgi:hypothetical protein